MKKERLDKWLVDNNFFETREKAKRSIIAGLVEIENQIHTKAGEQIKTDTDPQCVIIKSNPIKYVSRGGLKLEKALKKFNFPTKDLVFMDVGASTGGFTDCLLQNGAKRVYAIDVGYGQMDWSLRNDTRVILMERINFRYLEPSVISEKVDGIVLDTSFISITKLLKNCNLLLKEGGSGMFLIKPQFEAGRDKIGKNGIVRHKETHLEVLIAMQEALKLNEFSIMGMDFSPITGQKGNIEFLCHAQKCSLPKSLSVNQLIDIVNCAHNTNFKDGC